MRWSHLISYIIRSWLAYLTINGISWMLSRMQPRANNYLSVVYLWGTRKPEVTYAFQCQNNEKAWFSHFHMHRGIFDLSWVSWRQMKPSAFADVIWEESQARRNCVALSDYETLAYGFVAMPEDLLVYDRNSGVPVNFQLISWVTLWHRPHSTLANPIGHWDTLLIIEYFG